MPSLRPAAAGKGEAPPADFAAALKASIEGVDASQKASSQLQQRFQLGDSTVTLEDTMVAMAKANLSFQQMVQVRNKVIAAYHDIKNMPV
jgi:flagellar hook-basal body complex protein FliE